MPAKGFPIKKKELDIFFELLVFAGLSDKKILNNKELAWQSGAKFLDLNQEYFNENILRRYKDLRQNPDLENDKNFKQPKFTKTVIETLEKKISEFLNMKETRAIENVSVFDKKFEDLKNVLKELYTASAHVLNETYKYITISDHGFINTFKKSIWYCYTRCQDKTSPKIGRMVIEFGDFDKNLEANVLINHYEESLGQWEGKAKFLLLDKLLIVTATRKYQNKEYTHYLIRVENIGKKLKLCVGHVCFKHGELESIISKPIIIVRHHSDEKAIPSTFSFNETNVAKSIIQYFRKKELNRLATPGTRVIFDFGTLEDWLESTRSYNKKFKAIEGEYLIYFNFHPHEDLPVENSIKIYDADLEGLSISFCYSIDRETPKYWIGSGQMNFETKLLSAHLKGPKKNNIDDDTTKNLNDKPIHLLIDLPPADTEIVNTLCGIIGGYRDPERGSVARLFLMVRLEKNNKPENFDMDVVKKFFRCYSHRSWVRPPAQTSISKFEHVDLAVKTHMQKEYNSAILKQFGDIYEKRSIY